MIVPRALIVDDDPGIRALLVHAVTAEGFACETAGSVEAARALLGADGDGPELVLLDVDLPGESGLGLARELAGRRHGPAVVMVTGQDDPAVVALALEAGVLGYVTKPFEREELLAAVRKALRRRQALECPTEHLETGAHVERISGYCGLLAAHFGLDPDLMRAASRLRGRSGELLEYAAVIARTHHERFDGSGSPRGLAGEDIPLCGRIAGVADVFDGLIAGGPDRPALPFAEAVAALTAERGRRLDPAVVDAFLGDLDEVAAIVARFEPEGVGVPGAEPDPLLTLQEAASTLGVTRSRLRRWADDGRIAVVRTTGGHRRFPLDAVRRLAADCGTRPVIRPLAPPAGPLPTLAGRLRGEGGELARVAAVALYRGVDGGWFASAAAVPALDEWLSGLVHGSETGGHARSVEATDVLMRRARRHAVSLLERHSFLERFGQAAGRALSQAGAPRAELVAARRLFSALQQALLDGRG